MTAEAWAAAGVLGAALLAVLGTIVAARITGRSSQQAADSQAYQTALVIWQETVTGLQRQVGTLAGELATAQAEIVGLRSEQEREQRRASLREQQLERRVVQLEGVLVRHGIDVPAWAEDTSTVGA